jgi:hypothetical protein
VEAVGGEQVVVRGRRFAAPNEQVGELQIAPGRGGGQVLVEPFDAPIGSGARVAYIGKETGEFPLRC